MLLILVNHGLLVYQEASRESSSIPCCSMGLKRKVRGNGTLAVGKTAQKGICSIFHSKRRPVCMPHTALEAAREWEQYLSQILKRSSWSSLLWGSWEARWWHFPSSCLSACWDLCKDTVWMNQNENKLPESWTLSSFFSWIMVNKAKAQTWQRLNSEYYFHI